MASLLPVEIKFAQNLAANEKKIRFRAVKKLKKYLRAKSSSKKDGFTKEDLLKIWKGLHYCMWMQDKPLLQEELSVTLTQLVHEFSNAEAKILFVKVFFITEAREWNSIDVWRLDKFMMMVRNMLYESLIVVRKQKWAPELVDNLAQVFGDLVMNPNSDLIPDGLKIHFADIYLEEVEKAGGEQIESVQLVKLLDPFIKFIQMAKNPVLIKRVVTSVFEPVLARGAEVLRQRCEVNQEDEDESDVPYMNLKFDNKMLADHLFMVSQETCVLNRNRPVLYGLVRRLQDLEKGVLPKQKEIVITPGISHVDMQQAVNSLVNLDREKKKKKHKKKHKKSKIGNENEDPNNNSTDLPGDADEPQEDNEQSTSDGSGKKGGKRKHSVAKLGDEPLTKIKKKESGEKSDRNSGDNKTLKLIKDVFKGKSKKVRKSVESSSETVKASGNETWTINPDSGSNGTNAKASKKGDVNVGEQLAHSADIITVSAGIPDSYRVVSEQSSDPRVKGDTPADSSVIKSAKKTGKRLKGAKGSQTASTEHTPVSGKKRKIPAILVTDHSSPGNKGVTPVGEGGSRKLKTPDADLQEGEIEIFVPNKKFKKNTDSTPKSALVAFDGSKPPAAFVKRSLAKVDKTRVTPSTAPGSGKSMSEKKVSFNMKKNKAQGFKESLNSPVTPFNPHKKPDQSILKSASPVASTSSTTTTTPVTRTQRSSKLSVSTLPSPRSAQVIQKVKAKSARRASLPAVPVAVAKKPTPMKRARAVDFFL